MKEANMVAKCPKVCVCPGELANTIIVNKLL